MESVFVRAHARRADRVDLAPATARGPSTFIREVPVPPAPFQLAAPWRSASGFGPPSPPPSALGGAPMNRAFYLGLVDEVPEGAQAVTVTLWEWPSGRELNAVLQVGEHLGGQIPREGQRVRIWSWTELPGGGQRIPQVRVELEAEPPAP